MSKTCAICKKRPVEETFRPFCSKRCADIDLQRWFAGVYAVPGVENNDAPPDNEEEE